MPARPGASRAEARPSAAAARADRPDAHQDQPEQGRRRREEEPEGAAAVEGEAEREQGEPGEHRDQGGGLIAVDAADPEGEPQHQARRDEGGGEEPGEGRRPHAAGLARTGAGGNGDSQQVTVPE